MHTPDAERRGASRCELLARGEPPFGTQAEFIFHDRRIIMNKQIHLAIMLAILAIASVAGADDSATVKVFQEKCTMCHGPDGKAQTAMGKLLTMKDWTDGKTLNSLSDADITKEIHDGKAKMPAFTTLPADQITSLVDYIRTFQR